MNFPRIIESLDDLKSDRWKTLKKIFDGISLRKGNLNVVDISSSGNFILGLSDASQPGSVFRDWRFKTTSPVIEGNYHEIWSDLGKGKYFMNRSYLHLFFQDRSELVEKEYVLLHCDASEPNDSEHSIYKQSPHIHIEMARDPIPKAHFALYNGRILEVLKNLESFDVALKESIEMIDSQVIKMLS